MAHRFRPLNEQVGAPAEHGRAVGERPAVAVGLGAEGEQPLGNLRKIRGQKPVLHQPTEPVVGPGATGEGSDDARHGPFDGFVARAAADVAVDGGDATFVRRRFGVEAEPGQRHHEAHRAEPALGAAFVHERLLDGVEAGREVQPFDRDEVLAVGVAEGHQAGGHAAVRQPPVAKFANQHRAGPAVAFAAAGFGARQALMLPDEIKDDRASGFGGFNQAVVEEEAEHGVPGFFEKAWYKLGKGWGFSKKTSGQLSFVSVTPSAAR